MKCGYCGVEITGLNAYGSLFTICNHCALSYSKSGVVPVVKNPRHCENCDISLDLGTTYIGLYKSKPTNLCEECYHTGSHAGIDYKRLKTIQALMQTHCFDGPVMDKYSREEEDECYCAQIVGGLCHICERRALQKAMEKVISESIGIEIKCECGGEKAKTTHARWCPKYE